ncbi:hypothetical protein EC991_000279 [Linnemannia zychae]|nr:hypothetical protein EC991_000279 [Linnemannia zychae]
MSRKGTASSKFGHLFGDSDSSSASTRESRLSGSGGAGDLYKDPLAAFIPPITATTATTRGGSSTTKATLSPPPSSTTAGARASGSPPTSGPNSRSSSRAQNHALFSSLTGGGGSGGGGSDSGSISGGSLFDSTPTPTLSAAKRDLLFGDGASSTSSSSRRTSTPPLSRNSNATATATTQHSSTRVPTPPISGSGSTLTRGNNTTLLDADSSPLSGPLGDFGVSRSKQQQKEQDQDVLSPLSTAPLTRTNSQASTNSHESVRSSKSARSQDVPATDVSSSSSSILRAGINTKPSSSLVAGAAGAGSVTKEASPLIPSSSSSSTSSFARRVVTRTSMDHSQRQTAVASEVSSPVISDPIFNPLTAPASSQLPPPPRQSSDWGTPQTIPSTASSQSIDTFQSISRTSSPAPTATLSRPLVLSKNGFERDHLDSFSTPPSSLSPSPLSKSVPMMIPADDDAAAAFASDNLYTFAGPNSTSVVHPSSSSMLDSGFSHSRTSSSSYLGTITTSTRPTTTSLAGSSTVAGAAAIAAAASAIKPGVGIGAGTVGQLKTRSGFSLGEDVADSSNPWMNSLVDSLDNTKLSSSSSTSRESTPKIVDYTQSEAASAAFSSPVLPPSLSSKSGSSLRRTVITPLPPSLEDDVGGFEDMFAGLGSSSSSGRGRDSGAATPTPSLFPPTSTSSKSSSQQNSTSAAGAATGTASLSLSSWNVLDAVEAAAQDPDFLGPSSIVNQSTAKVLAMMQMPKDALDKDISAQEVFDNPWE